MFRLFTVFAIQLSNLNRLRAKTGKSSQQEGHKLVCSDSSRQVRKITEFVCKWAGSVSSGANFTSCISKCAKVGAVFHYHSDPFCPTV